MVFKRPKYADQRVELKNNSLLVMRPPTNRLWTHGIPAEKEKPGVRLNLTFRRMKTEKPTQEEKVEKTLKRKADDDDDEATSTKRFLKDKVSIIFMYYILVLFLY